MAITFGSKPAEFKYVELPWEAIAAAGAAKQKRYDESDKVITDINENFLKIGSREEDTPKKQQLVNELQQEIYNVADTYSGDLGAALPKIKELQRKINYEMNYGELGAIKKNYDLEQARFKKIQESLDSYNEGKGGLDAYDAAALLAHDKKINKGPTQKIGSTWSTYKETPMYATQDYSKAAREIADKIDISTLEQFSGMKHIGNGIFMDEKTTTERRDQDIIEEYVTNALLADPKYAQYLDWKNTITGKKDNVLNVLQNQTVTTPDGINYLPQIDAAGNEVGAVNPTAWANEYLTSDFRQAGRSAGEIFQRNKITRDRKYATPDLGSGKEEAPALGINVFGTKLTNLPQAERLATNLKSDLGKIVNPTTGEIKSSTGISVGKPLEQVWAGLKAGWGIVSSGAIGLMPGYGAESTVRRNIAQQTFFNELEAIAKKYDDPGESVTEASKVLREQFPSLNLLPSDEESRIVAPGTARHGMKAMYDPNDSKTWVLRPGERESVYDKNSGIIVNATTQAMTKAQQSAGNITVLPDKNTKAIQNYFVNTGLIGNESFGTLVTPDNPKNPEKALQELTSETDGQIKEIQFAGISDVFSGSKLVFKVNGKTALFQPSDQMSKAKLQVSQAVSESYASQKPQTIQLSDGNYLRIQPDVVPSYGSTFTADGSNAKYTVNAIYMDKNGSPVNFPGTNTNIMPAEQYYQYYELPAFLQSLGVK